ncbi:MULTISPECIES: hypothetical protein [unclassified Mycobacterium]|uniref:hypothetical protein n=1 Tax=unclassified Mycobacterium TaxID=2642494 RepID=UPI0029C7036D|nr:MULTISPECIES: hypothetical protein [unclassified Mycobacterium]
MLGGDVMHPITYSDLEVVERAVRTVRASAVVLPATDLSGFHGFPLIEWSAGLADRLRGGAGPMLDRATLSLWESWPSGVECAPPPAPLRILGFASTASWRHAVRATRALRGFGAGCVLTTTRPSVIRLSEADFAGVYVIQVSHDGANEVLVHGRGGIESASRMVATRYWEERLLAHALRVGAVRRPPWTGQA